MKSRRTPTLRSVYGELRLPKGTTLYHASETPFAPNPRKPMLFTTFHPSEWSALFNEYITPVTLKRDVSLLFMVGGFSGVRILPLLDTLINQPGSNLAKQHDRNLACYVDQLKADSFDGWFSTIEGKAFVEVALINDMDIYEVGPSLLTQDSNWNTQNVNYRPSRFHSQFPLSILTLPASLTINSRYRPEIERYLEVCGTGWKFVAQVLFTTSAITYVDAPSAFIKWAC